MADCCERCLEAGEEACNCSGPTVDDLDLSQFDGHTPGPWLAFRMVDEAGNPLRGDAAAKYVADCIGVNPENDFFAVAQPGESKPDVCHTGNGPTSAVNAALIAAAQAMLAEVRRLRERVREIDEREDSWSRWTEADRG